MSTIPTVSDKEIEARVGDRSFRRGQRYHRDGAIFDGRKQGLTLRARCEGSAPEAYRVWVTFDAERLAEAECSCPVGGGGHCKHVAALLLTWCESPDEFVEAEEVEAVLKRLKKAELIALVKQMLRQEPDLEVLLETPLPAVGGRRTPVSPETYRRQADAAFRRGGYGWGVAAEIARELSAIEEIGDGFVQQQDFASGAAVYEGVSAAVLDNYETFRDDEGDLGSVVQACVTGLGECLAGEEADAATRGQILQTLFAVLRFDVSLGGVGLSDDVPELIAQHATVEERGHVADWVREELPSARDWCREVYGGFLLDLEAEELSDEAFLQVCRDTGRNLDLVDRLLELRRLDEATKEAEQAGDYHLLSMADIFVRRRHGDLAERLMRERSEKTTDTRILEWLQKRYASRPRDKAAALDLAESIFRTRPSLEKYKDMRKLAQGLGRWEALRPELLALLNKPQHSDLLIRIRLHEGEIDEAIEAAKAGREYPYYGYSMKLEVAKAAEQTRPRAALEIYRQRVENLIAQRGRDRYREACRFLKKVRTLYEQLGESQEWTRYLTRLREDNHTLRALRQELAAAKL